MRGSLKRSVWQCVFFFFFNQAHQENCSYCKGEIACKNFPLLPYVLFPKTRENLEVKVHSGSSV